MAAAVLFREAPDLCATGRGLGLVPSLFEEASQSRLLRGWEELLWRLRG